MRLKPIFTTMVGVSIAAASVYVAKEGLLDPDAGAAQATTPSMVEVVVARADIDFSQPIEAHMLATQPWPREALPTGAFTTVDQILASGSQEARRAKGRIFLGEVMLASKVSGYGEKVTLVQKLGENTRAMAIKVDAVTAVGGFVTPGDYVDIMMTQGNRGEFSAVTILQNVRVLGVDQQSEEINDSPEVARTLTVEVTPEEGQKLALAQKAGSLSLALRTLDGVVDEPMERVDLSDLLRHESPLPDDERGATIVLRRGTVAEEVDVR